MEERRGSALLSQLGLAKQKISTLEEFIRDREKQLQVAVSRMRVERHDSRPHRLRRAGRSNDALLRMRSVSRDEPEEDPGALCMSLGEYVCLTLVRMVEDRDSDEPVPFVLRRLVSRKYDVGPDGITIGTGGECGVCLPKESGVWSNHVRLKWVPGSPKPLKRFPMPRRGSKLTQQGHVDEIGYYVLEDLTEGKGVFHVIEDPMDSQQASILEGAFLCPDSSVEVQIDQSIEHKSVPEILLGSCNNQLDFGSQNQSGSVPESDQSDSRVQCKTDQSSPFCTTLTHGVRFVTGNVEWSVTALPVERVLTLKMFASARSGNLDGLRNILETSTCSNLTVPYVIVSPAESDTVIPGYRYSSVSVATEGGVDINAEYQLPSFEEDNYYNQVFSRRRSSALVSPLSPTPPSPHTPRLLLHIAIENGDVEMVQFLLEKGADVNRCVGDHSQNSLHLAARGNHYTVMVELLRYGGDVEIQDGQHFLPLALTSSYDIRKLLLNTVLLCAAADAGDLEEVTRLLSTINVSPNGRGLRHKNALHLASARGKREVVECLVMNGAYLNARGGSRQRTPLHYASLNNHVAIATILLQAGANEFARDSGGYTSLNLSMGGEMCKLLHKQPLSLSLAVQSGDVEYVERILVESEEGSGEGEGEGERIVDQRNEQSHAPLHLACTTGNIEMARVLVSHGAHVNLHGGSDSWTPLFYAAMAGHEDLVDFLLSVGASTEECDCHGSVVQERVEQAVEEMRERLSRLEKRGRAESVVETAMHTLLPASMTRQESAPSCSVESELQWLKTRCERLKAVSRLLTSGPDRLLRAMETRNIKDFTQLLESGTVEANVLVDKRCPCPALVRVCEDGLYPFAEALLKAGANPSPSGPQDQIPLLVAAGNGHLDLLQLLVTYGANINIQSSDSLTTPLHEAATANCVEEVEYLLSLGADIKMVNSVGESPFDCSALLEIRRLLATGPNRLLVAASTGDHESIKQHVEEEGISPSHEFQHGVTALHEACEGGHVEAMQVLVSLGADVNAQVHTTQVTPLHIASRLNHSEVAQVLLEAGARLDIKDSEGKVPFEVASTNHMRKILVEARTIKPPPVNYSRENSAERRCMICMDNLINTIILPCGHQAFCTTCVSRITTCALDRQTIREVITVFK